MFKFNKSGRPCTVPRLLYKDNERLCCLLAELIPVHLGMSPVYLPTSLTPRRCSLSLAFHPMLILYGSSWIKTCHVNGLEPESRRSDHIVEVSPSFFVTALRDLEFCANVYHIAVAVRARIRRWVIQVKSLEITPLPAREADYAGGRHSGCNTEIWRLAF